MALTNTSTRCIFKKSPCAQLRTRFVTTITTSLREFKPWFHPVHGSITQLCSDVSHLNFKTTPNNCSRAFKSRANSSERQKPVLRECGRAGRLRRAMKRQTQRVQMDVGNEFIFCFFHYNNDLNLLAVVLSSYFAITICCAIHKLSSWGERGEWRTKERKPSTFDWKRSRASYGLSRKWMKKVSFCCLPFRFRFHQHVLFLILLCSGLRQ